MTSVRILIVCGCIAAIMAGCNKHPPASVDPATAKELNEIKDRSTADDDIVSCANAYCLEQNYKAGKGAAPKPTAVDSRIGSVSRGRVLVLVGYCPDRNIDAFSVFFFDSNRRLCEIVVERISLDNTPEMLGMGTLLNEVPLSHFDAATRLVVDAGGVLAIPAHTRMAVAWHAVSGVMSNAVAVWEVGGQATSLPCPATQRDQ